MYRTFNGLTRNPFKTSPYRCFYYPTTRHNGALAALNYISRHFTKEAGDRTV